MAAETRFGMRLAPDEHRLIERLAQARGTTMRRAVFDAVRGLDTAAPEGPVPTEERGD